MKGLSYDEFLRRKRVAASPLGFDVPDDAVHPLLKDHQRTIVRWLVRMGRAGCFAAFGLGKSLIQLETVRLVREHVGGMGLIVIPLGVRQEFKHDAAMIGTAVKFIRRASECTDPDGIYLTNYETVRDEKLDPRLFSVTSLDEASALRGFGGTKTFRAFMRLFNGVRFKFVATATPSPNNFIELLAYSAYLEIMDIGQAKTRFFKRNSEKADSLTIHPHKEREFWLWVATWGVFVQRPSDLGFSDEGYTLPPIEIHWHEIPADHSQAGEHMDGQKLLLQQPAIGIQAAAAEKRRSLPERIAKMMDLRALDPNAHRLIWHDLERERATIQKTIPGVTVVYGSQPDADKERNIIAFSEGRIRELAGKPSMLGSGCNFQRHCAWAIFLGIGFKFNDFIQAIHRIQRFLQDRPVRIDLIYTENEREVRRTLERKWAQHTQMVAKMGEIIQEYGLSHEALAESMCRAMGVERISIEHERYRIVNNDCVDETRRMADDSVHLILTSIPFSTQYEYSPNYADFGHTDDNDHFFRQLDYLTPELLRVLQPGRVAVIHVKDRIVPSGLSRLGFQTVYPFHIDCIRHYTRHGFGYLGMKTIVTDVVRENNQTYRLGWSNQCKDATSMGVGMPEYLLLFRKPPTDRSNGWSDNPVIKTKPLVQGENGPEPFQPRDKRKIIPGSGYSRARWQIDAHGFERSSGNRLLAHEEIKHMPHEAIFKAFRQYGMENVYDYEFHVRLGETLEGEGKLPVTFMLLQPPSWHPNVWTDVARMLSLNSAQSAKGKQMHLCPMQFDIADRVIDQLSTPGETVYDPFGGLMTVPYRAILKGRFGIGTELAPGYFLDGAHYCEAAARKVDMPDLFSMLDLDEETGEAEKVA